jgi:thioredoxin 1
MALIHFNQEGFDKALASNSLMMVDFWATWCGPCKMLTPVMEELAEDYEGKAVVIGKVDVDENPELARRYGVMSVPTVIFFKDGQELERKIGAMPGSAYSDVLDDNL